MPRLRLTILLAAAATAVLAGCTDPSPDTSTEAPTSDSSTTASADATTGSGEDTGAVPESEPVFGTATNPGGGGSICLDDGEPVEATLSTVLTAISGITIDAVTLTPESTDVEILDQYVLPYDGGLGGLTFGDYPPDDRDGERADAPGYQLEAGETITIGVGFSIVTDAEPTSMTLGIAYKAAGSGDTQELESSYRLVISEDCDPNAG